MDMNVTGHTKFFFPIMFFSVDIYFGEGAECGTEKMKGGTHRKLVPGEHRGHIDIGQ
jgi:hypothetical protein